MAPRDQCRVAAEDGGVRGQDEGDLRRPARGRIAGAHRGPAELRRVRRRRAGLRDAATAGGHGRARPADDRHGPRGHRRDHHVPAGIRGRVGAGRPGFFRRVVPAAERRPGCLRGLRPHPPEAGGQAAPDRSGAGGRRARSVLHPVPRPVRGHGDRPARVGPQPEPPGSRRGVGSGRPPRGCGVRARRGPGTRPGAHRFGPLQHPAGKARCHPPVRGHAGHDELHRWRPPAQVPQLAVGHHGGRLRLAAVLAGATGRGVRADARPGPHLGSQTLRVFPFRAVFRGRGVH